MSHISLDQKMRIAYFITGLGLGGAEIVTIGIANEMVRRGHDVLLVYLTGGNAHAPVIDPRVEVVGLGMRKSPAGLFGALRKARKLLRRFRPDVVHGNMVHANLFVRILRLFAGIPRLVCSEHSKNIEGRGRMWAYRGTDFLSDVNTNVSQEATDHFIAAKAFGPRKSFAMYNGIDLRCFTPDAEARARIRREYGIPDDEFLWINVGRLTEAKDQANLLRAFEKTGFGWLMIVGEGKLRGVLEQRIGKMPLGGRVVLTGAHTNVADYYRAADCFVLSSAWEGFGIVLAEAMSCGLPVLSTDSGGCAEVVDDPCRMVPVCDSDALAARMKEMCRLGAEERAAIGAANRQKAKRFDLVKICDRWEQIYSAS